MSLTLLDAIEDVLCVCERPLSARAIAEQLEEHTSTAPRGATPWKTIGARLAEDIRSNAGSRFMRVGPGLYALTSWIGLVAVNVPARRVNPLDEDILVVDRDVFGALKSGRRIGRLYNIGYGSLLKVARPVHRMRAEEDNGLVQLIPSFLIFREDAVLSFRRTRKTPEQRLHDSISIVFGGHLQAEDSPALFADVNEQVERFLFRELHEELGFSPPFLRSRYCGVLHLEGTAFEQQHAGVVFAIELQPDTVVESLEPGFHSGLRFIPWDGISSSPVMADRWSATCVAHMLEAE